MSTSLDLNQLKDLTVGSVFIPIKGNKLPLESAWQKTGYSLEQLGQKFNDHSQFKAVGILTGDDLLAIDVDGVAAYAKAQELSGLENPFPATVMFTSRKRLEGEDKPSKFQALYRVPNGWNIKNKPINCVAEHGTEQLDFRYNGRQSVIMGEHPETGAYRFVSGYCPESVAIADCPLWVKDYFDSLNSQPEITPTKTINYTYSSSIIPPLEYFLAKNNQRALDGLPKGSRFYGLQALAADLIGCVSWLNSNGVIFLGDAEQLFLDACQNSGSNDLKTLAIWTAFNKKSCSPAISSEGMEKRLHWYKYLNDSDYRERFIANWKAKNPYTNRIDNQYQDYLKWEQEQERIEQAVEEDRLFNKSSTFIEDLKAKALKLSKKWFKGFGTTKKDLEGVPTPEFPEKIEYDPDIPFPTKVEYEGRRAPVFIIDQEKYPVEQFIYSAIKAGWSDLIDQSPTGSGKSYSVGLMLPLEGKHWYIDIDHNNPSTQSIKENYKNLPARHNGLTRGTDGKLKRSYSSDDKIEVPSNCHLTEIFHQLADKNIEYQIKEDKAPNPICAVCPSSGLCATSEGNGYGYRAQRKEALERLAIRADIRSLPSADDFDYSKDLFFVEEGTKALNFTEEVKAGVRDFDGLFCDLESQLPEVHFTLKTLRLALRPYLTGEKPPPRYGLDTRAILELLGNPPATLALVIEELENLIQDLAFEKRPSLTLSAEDKQLLKTNPKAYEAKKRLNQMARSFDNADYFKAYLDKLENLCSNFLVPLLKVWGGANGAIRLAWGELKITYANERTIQILKAARSRIYLDATPNTALIALGLGIEENSILRFSRKVETPKNLTIKPIHISGISSRDWGDSAIERVVAIQKELIGLHPDLVKIGYKALVEKLDLDGWWGNHNRGTNEFVGKKAMVFYGLPTPNVGQVQDEYLALKGSLDGFEAYYDALVQTEIIQALGRSRASLDPDNQYVIYLVGQWENFDLSFLTDAGFNVEPVKDGFEVVPSAGDKVQVKQHILIEQILQAIKGGANIAKLTQTELAHLTGFSQQTISRLLSGFANGFKGLKNLLILLYETINRKMGKISAQEIILMCQELREWLKLDPALITEEILGLAAELEVTEDSLKLAKISDFILGHPQPLLVLGHILGLIDGNEPVNSA